MTPQGPQRLDHQLILDMVKPNSRVLDLGCGNGALLEMLIQQKNCHGTGIEIDEKAIYQCVAKGLTVSHGDIDSGLEDFSDRRFDVVILNESLQEVLHPQKVILEALRVGREAIVGIPNFCHWRARLQIFLNGRVPVTSELPHQWYDTPNLRFLSLKDFKIFSRDNDIKILDERAMTEKKVVHFRPNFFGLLGIYRLQKN